MERFEALTEKSKQRTKTHQLKISLGEASRMGSKVLSLGGATARRGEKTIFQEFW